VYGTTIQSVETVEHLIFNHPIDDILSISKGGDLLQAMGIRDVRWNVVQQNWVAVGYIHSLKCNKPNKPLLHRHKSLEHRFNVKRIYLLRKEADRPVGLSCKDRRQRPLAWCRNISPPPPHVDTVLVGLRSVQD
jgi:hypothetical protein